MMMMMMMMNKKRKQIGSSTANEEDLTEDLILEIFSHLPPISLLRFKSLSKTFNSLMSNTDFLRRNTVHHFRRQDPSPPPPPGILLKRQVFSDDSKILIFPPPPLHGDGHQHYYYSSQLLQKLIDYRPEHDQPLDVSDDHEKVKFCVIDSCNGLLLYLNRFKNRNPPINKCIWYLCNPITKDYIKLPTLEEEQGAGVRILKYSSANIVFDPSVSLTYKVVIWLRCRCNYSQMHHYRLYVYSSETRSWRLSYSSTQSWTLPISDNDWVLRNHFNHDYRAVLLKGVLYWSAILGPHLDDSLCYDVEKDLVWTLKLPKKPLDFAERVLFYFGVCGGGLRLIEQYYNNDQPSSWSFDVMELNQLQLMQKQEPGSWTVKYHVNIDRIGYHLVKERSLFGAFILDIYETTTKEEEMLLCKNNRLIVAYNLSKKTWGKKLKNVSWIAAGLHDHSGVLKYTITLFPLH